MQGAITARATSHLSGPDGALVGTRVTVNTEKGMYDGFRASIWFNR